MHTPKIKGWTIKQASKCNRVKVIKFIKGEFKMEEKQVIET